MYTVQVYDGHICIHSIYFLIIKVQKQSLNMTGQLEMTPAIEDGDQIQVKDDLQPDCLEMVECKTLARDDRILVLHCYITYIQLRRLCVD